MSLRNQSPRPDTPTDVIYHISSSGISFLEGQLLTLLEAGAADPEQRKALKDLARPMIWQWAHQFDINPDNQLTIAGRATLSSR